MKTILAIIIIALIGCAEMPVVVGVQGEYGTYSYSAERGIEISINATK